MTFYPILQVPGFEGSVTLHNFSPNNFQSCKPLFRHAYAAWADGKLWNHHKLATLAPGESLVIRRNELDVLASSDSLIIVYLCSNSMPLQTSSLQDINSPFSTLPAWRATISLELEGVSKTSYQGEIDPFPKSGTCLTFNYLVQQSDDTSTWMLALNLLNEPLHNPAEILFFDPTQSDTAVHQETMRTNCINSFLLPQEIATNKNIAIICKDASFIPVFFSHDQTRTQLSLEHTHPPACTAIFGNRWKAQKKIKNNWMSQFPLGRS